MGEGGMSSSTLSSFQRKLPKDVEMLKINLTSKQETIVNWVLGLPCIDEWHNEESVYPEWERSHLPQPEKQDGKFLLPDNKELISYLVDPAAGDIPRYRQMAGTNPGTTRSTKNLERKIKKQSTHMEVEKKSESSSPSNGSAQEAQKEAKQMLRKVVKAAGWTENRDGKEYILSDNAGHPLDKIDTGYKNRKLASMTSPSRDGEPVTLKVNTEWWHNHSKEEQLGLICHEATHLKVHSGNGSAHRPEFWEVNIEVYKAVAESSYFQCLNWSEVAGFAVDDPNSACVDRRSESVEERRQKMKVVKNFR